MSDLRMCTMCLRYKPPDEFTRRPDHRSQCRDCRNAYLRERRKTPGTVKTHSYGGYTQGCRCDTCKSAKAAYMAARRGLAYIQPALSDSQDITHATRFAYEERGCRCGPCVAHQRSSSRHPAA